MIHTIVGTLDQAYNHFNNPTSEVSAHYGVEFNGTIQMYVTPSDTAWANGILKPNNKWPGSQSVNPNLTTISIETEGGPTDPVTQEMYNAVKYVCQQSINTFPTISYLVPHNIISATQCPGTRWTAGKIQQLGSELGLKVIV